MVFNAAPDVSGPSALTLAIPVGGFILGGIVLIGFLWMAEGKKRR